MLVLVMVEKKTHCAKKSNSLMLIILAANCKVTHFLHLFKFCGHP